MVRTGREPLKSPVGKELLGRMFNVFGESIVDLEDTVEGCERIINDEFSDRPESDLYMTGSIKEEASQ